MPFVVVERGFFCAFTRHVFGAFRDKSLNYYMVICNPHWPFTYPKTDDVEWPFYVKILFSSQCV